MKIAILAILYLPLAIAQTACASTPTEKPAVNTCTGMFDCSEDVRIFAHSKPYAVWRARMLRRGWKPRITNDTYIDGTKVKDSGEARDMLDAGFVEVEDCSGTDYNFCDFNFKKGDYCLKIITIGELDGKLRNRYRMPVFYSKHIWQCTRKTIKNN